MKKKFALTMAMVMAAAALTAGVNAADYTTVNLLVNNKAVETDQPAVIVESRTMVPVRVIAENLGSTVDWDANTKTVTFTYGDITAALEIGGANLAVTAGGVTQQVPVDSPATIINSRTMVPVRFLSETFGYKVDWDAQTKTVNVTNGNAEDEVTTPAAVEAAEDKQYEGMADDELKEAALLVDGYAKVLNNSSDKMDKTQSETYAKYCDAVATVLKTLDSGKYTEAEITASQAAIAEAKAGMEVIAEELKVKLPAEEEVTASESTTEESTEAATEESTEATTEETTEAATAAEEK